jgi:hypothetical protein
MKLWVGILDSMEEVVQAHDVASNQNGKTPLSKIPSHM